MKRTRSILKSYFNVGDQPSEQHFVDVFDSTLNLSEDNAITGSLTISGSAVNLLIQGDITASNVSVSGNIIASKLNTGQGLNELYDMNQNVKTTSAVTFTTVDTGQGANELFDMNQNVMTTSSPSFAGLTLINSDYGTYNLSAVGNHTIEGGLKGTLIVRAVPSMAAGASSSTRILEGGVIKSSSVILISTSAHITCNATAIANGSCKITFHNPTLTAFESANVSINIAII